VLRSITCETGPSADLEVLRALYDLLKARAPGTLVEDDSSWIGWNRIHDFWDDHPYGNNSTWRETLARLHDHRVRHGMKPLLLGEAIAADTWIDTRRLLDASVDGRPWWTPRWLDDALDFERDLEERFTAPGFSPVEDLKRVSRKYAMDMRRFQIETFRETLPSAGYVVSTLRDVRLCAMGLLDDFEEPKWSAIDWAWHRANAAPLPSPGDARAFHGAAPLPEAWARIDGIDAAGFDAAASGPTRLRATLPGRDDPPERPGSRPSWEVWVLPDLEPVPPGWCVHGDPGVREVEGLVRLFPEARVFPPGEPIPEGATGVVTCTLTAPLLEWMIGGGRVLHLTSLLPGSIRTDDIWFLRGTAWAPPEPRDFFSRVPREMLSYLQLFELEGGCVIRGERLYEEVDPLLAFLETHDLDRVRPNLLLFQTRVGKGRLGVTCLRHEGGEQENYAGVWLARELVRTLVEDPPPERALSEETIEALRLGLAAETLRVDGSWRFRRDPRDEGRDAAWFAVDLDDRDASGWTQVTPRAESEAEAWNAYDGWAWYRKRIEIPVGWRDRRVRIVFESVDDMYELFVNGRPAGGHGKIDRSETSYLRRTWLDVGPLLEPGASNLFAVRVHDWLGGAGLNGAIWITTGPVDEQLDLLRR
jgi:hypothetical protein